MKWFRFYSEALHDPKVRQLPPALFKDWVLILCIANDGKPRGTLPPVEDIAYHLNRSPVKVVALLTNLMGRGLLDTDAGKGVSPHNWNGRQCESDSRDTEGRRKHDDGRRKHGAKWESAPQDNGASAAADTETEQTTEAEDDA